MPTPERLHGVIPAIPTPFTTDGREVDEAALRRVVRHVVDGGVHGIMTTGGTGEFPHLSREERRRVTEIVASEAGGAAPDLRRHRGVRHLGSDRADGGRRGGRRGRRHPDPSVLLPDPGRHAPPPLRGRGRSRRPTGRRLQQPALHRQQPEPAADRGADGAAERDRAQAVERRPRTARRGAPAVGRQRPLALHRHRQPVLRRALRRGTRDLLDGGGHRPVPDGAPVRPRPGGRSRRCACPARAPAAAQPLPRVRPRLRLADEGGARR